jgi:two-component system sensor histidine kinase KdpD
MARELSGALSVAQVQEIAGKFARDFLGASVSLLLPDKAGQLVAVGGRGAMHFSAAHLQAVYTSGEPMMFVADRSGFSPAMIFPLTAPLGVRGVMVIAAQEVERVLPKNRRPLLEAVASLAAIVVERLHYVDVAQHAQLGVESERLRSSLLSAVSHDLRTPLTVLVGLADSLTLSRPALAGAQQETAAAIRDQSMRMSSLVHNLLDMARLQSGSVRLRKEWQPLEEIVGSSLASLESHLVGQRVITRLPADLPLLAFDAVLMERVLFNLLENAIKFAPGGEIVIAAQVADGEVEISVCDEGPGLVPGSENAMFELFERGRQEGATSGVGLGLAICRAIVEAHGGRIMAANKPEGGACFSFFLPLGVPPALDEGSLAPAAEGRQ